MNSAKEINPPKHVAPPQQLSLLMDEALPRQLTPAPKMATSAGILRSGSRPAASRNAKESVATKKRGPRRDSSQVPGGAALFQRVFTRLGCDGRPPRFLVEFYPYASLVLTIRRREDSVFVRFSDLLQRAPLAVLEGAAALLLSRVYRRKAPHVLITPYLNYARSNRTRSRISRMRRGRVRLASTGPQGCHFDLDKMFEHLNQKYFSGTLQRPHIGWSVRSWRRQFGCYDPGPNQILLNRRMDHPAVPQVAVEYVLYHEMLHVKHPTRRSGCSLVSHSPEFRAEEKLFPQFTQARKVLDRLAR
jgi:metallopeptidase YgjP-like protein